MHFRAAAARGSLQSRNNQHSDIASTTNPADVIATSSSTGSSSVTAANKWYRKSVYVDNVDSNVTEDSMKAFIRSLSVRLNSNVVDDQTKKRRIDDECRTPVPRSSTGQSEISHTDMDMDATILAETTGYSDVDLC